MEELTTRGPVKDATGLTAAWALQSGRTTERFTGPARRTETLPGIRLSIPTQGAPAVLELADAHEAGELYTQLEAHLENIAAPAAEEEAKTAEDALASPVEARGAAILDRDVRGWTDTQCRGAWNHAMEGRNPNDLTDRPTGRYYSSLAAAHLRERLNRINGADAERDTLQPPAPKPFGFTVMVPLEWNSAAADALAEWRAMDAVEMSAVRRHAAALAAALDRLANASR